MAACQESIRSAAEASWLYSLIVSARLFMTLPPCQANTKMKAGIRANPRILRLDRITMRRMVAASPSNPPLDPVRNTACQQKGIASQHAHLSTGLVNDAPQYH